jgi:Asp-tRNA(Asn)/Glu-tRNA(Gln) amidotransferase A subunit family amidase
VPAGAYLEQTEPAALDAFEAQLAALSDAGFEIERIDVLDDVELLNAHHLRLMQAEAAVVHQRWFDRFRELYRPALTALIVEGRGVGPDEADAIRGGRSALRAALEAAMDEREIDVWTCPAAPGPAPFGLRSTGSAVMNIPWTHAGMPVVTVPSGTLESMPLGLQLVARAGADEELFMWAARVEDALRPD